MKTKRTVTCFLTLKLLLVFVQFTSFVFEQEICWPLDIFGSYDPPVSAVIACFVVIWSKEFTLWKMACHFSSWP